MIGDTLSAVVRPVIAVIFAVVACWAFLIGILNADQWMGLATMVVAFYFAAKTAENASKRAPFRSTDSQVQVDQAENINVEAKPELQRNGGKK